MCQKQSIVKGDQGLGLKVESCLVCFCAQDPGFQPQNYGQGGGGKEGTGFLLLFIGTIWHQENQGLTQDPAVPGWWGLA